MSAMSPICPCMPHAEVVRLWKAWLDLGRTETYRPRTHVFVQGSLIHHMLLLECGFVKLDSTSRAGRDTLLDLRCAGQWLDYCPQLTGGPETASWDGYRYAFSAIACTACTVYRCDLERFQYVLAHNIEAANLLLGEQAADHRKQVAMLRAMKLLDAQERLQHFLTRILPCALSGRPLKDHEIAALIGVSKQHFVL